jgi:rubrerythrin
VSDERPGSEGVRDLHEARVAEKLQTLFYRDLAEQAEEAGDAGLAESLNELLADEQHHLSRITARLLEMAEPVENLIDLSVARGSLAGWESAARQRERAEIQRYELLLTKPLDARTAELIAELLRVEREHERNLAGKWMGA